jgi:alpha-L-fucosidase 2
MLEALVQSSPLTDKDDRITSFSITLLPALPECMASGSVKGLRLRGGYSLDMKWQDRAVLKNTIHNSGCKLYYGG